MEFVPFFLGLLSGIITATFERVILGYYYRPILKLLDDEPEVAGRWSGHSIRVTNSGRTAAKSCQVMLSMPDITKDDLCRESDVLRLRDLGLDPSKWNVSGEESFALTEANFRQVSNELLAWSQMGNPIQVDLYPNTYQMIDVFRLMKGATPQLHVATERGWSCLRGAFRLRSYRMILTVVAENARPVAREYVVELQGNEDAGLVGR